MIYGEKFIWLLVLKDGGKKTGKDHKRFYMALVRTLWGFDLQQREKGTSSCGQKREALGDRCLWWLTHFPMSDLNFLVRWESLQPKPFLETPTSFSAILLANFSTSSVGDRTQEGPAKQHTESAGQNVWAKAMLRKCQLWPRFDQHCCYLKQQVAERCSELPIELVPGGSLFSLGSLWTWH